MKSKIELNRKTYVLEGTDKRSIPFVKVKNKQTYCIIRTYSAGVFAGWIDRNVKGKENTIYNARRLWKWSGALDCSQLAMHGIDKPDDCKFSNVSEVDLKEIIEITPCTEKSKKSIESVKEWLK